MAPMSGERNSETERVGVVKNNVDQGGGGVPLRPLRIPSGPVSVSLEDSELLPPTHHLDSDELCDRSERKPYDPERYKTVLAFLCIAFASFCNFFFLTIVHEVVPRDKPLPDIAFMIISQQPEWALPAGDIITAIGVALTFLLVIFHKYRWVVFRRIFLLAAYLYGLRAVVMFVTFLPPSFDDPSKVCLPRRGGLRASTIFTRLGDYIMTLGLTSSEGKILCGDLMFSGHTVALTLINFTLLHYAPRAIQKYSLYKWLLAIPIYFGMATLIISGGHYTMDVLIAYWLSSHLYWSYHQIFETRRRRRGSLPISHLWWFWISYHFETNIPFDGRVPNEFQWPLPWPVYCVKLMDRWSRRLNEDPQTDSSMSPSSASSSEHIDPPPIHSRGQ